MCLATVVYVLCASINFYVTCVCTCLCVCTCVYVYASVPCGVFPVFIIVFHHSSNHLLLSHVTRTRRDRAPLRYVTTFHFFFFEFARDGYSSVDDIIVLSIVN